MKLPPELAIAPQFHVYPLIKRQAQQIERLVDIAATLGRHAGRFFAEVAEILDSGIAATESLVVLSSSLWTSAACGVHCEALKYFKGHQSGVSTVTER